MKVLFINSDCGCGSTGSIVCKLCHAVEQRGGEYLLGYGREFDRKTFHALRIGNKRSVYWHAFQTRIFDSQGKGSLSATKKFLKSAQQFQPDLIHLHNLHGSYLHVPCLFEWIKTSRIPVIWTFHDCWPFTGHCTNYTAAQCMKWKTGCHHCTQKSVYPASYFLDRSAQNYDWKQSILSIPNLTITVVSPWLYQQVEQSFFSGTRVRCIPNGFDRDIFTPTYTNFRKQYGLQGKTILLGVASVWSEQKGLLIFQRLAECLPEEYQIVLVGVNSKQKRTLDSRILCLEKVTDPKELAGIYTAANLFLNLSMEETFGLVSLEALACGTPVISNVFSANPALITKENGCIVPELTASAFAEAIYRMKDQPKSSDECIDSVQQYDWEKIYPQYMQLYEELLENQGECLL